MRQRIVLVVLLLVMVSGVHGFLSAAAPAPFSPDECARRRAQLMATAREGLIVLFGDSSPRPGARFRQDNDFYYLTGCNDREAALVMAAASGEAHLFLPEQSAREIMVEGGNLLTEEGAATRLRLKSIAGLSTLDGFLARQFQASGPVIHARLAQGDAIDADRYEERRLAARLKRSRFNDFPGRDPLRAAMLLESFPAAELRDVTPLLEAMRLIKGAAEIDSLRRNGRLTAEAVRRAMLQTRPGAYEYTLEGAATGWVLGQGAGGVAFQPIVAAGLNACTWHYERNDTLLAAGELVLMDFGADLDHLCMDISRTWPVSGTFSREQKEIYGAVLEVQKATIAACRPGATAAQIRQRVAEVLAAKKIDSRGLQGDIHHFIGMSTHEGALLGGPLQPGMVLTVEPGLYLPERRMGVRIEDTILITADGCEILTAAAPKEINEIEALMKKGKPEEK